MNSSDASYKPDSRILIITLDSFFKETGGIPDYNPCLSISHKLPDQSKRIFEVRQNIWSSLRKDEIRWPNDNKELIINQKLVNAADFGGKETNALFLPAIHRYTGDFYQALGDGGKQALLKSKHHFLIISACYGILKPIEHIQNYACQFGNPPNKSYSQWVRRKQDITKILIAYLMKHGIKRIFDFTQCAVPAYQKAIKWDYIYQEFPGISVYHAHTWLPNDRSLRVFAEFISSKMLAFSEEDLLKIELDREIDNISFQKNLPNLEEQITSVIDPIDLILDNDENDFVEFKTSAFGGITPEKIKTLTTNHIQIFSRIKDCQKIAKTICAFMNSDGGYLFIGVKERESPEEWNQITGIESEMRKVEAGSYPRTTDGYARLIQDGIIDVFIPEYNSATRSIKKIDFIDHEGHTVCWIKVEPSRKPVFMTDYERIGEHQFYIRDGRESKPLDVKKAAEYILVHFCPKQ